MPMGSVANVVRQGSKIPSITHPHYKRFQQEWFKWRLTFEGGERFIRQYLVRFSNKEDNREFVERRRLTYCPAFASAAIKEIRNSIFSRTNDIVREGGSDSYQKAVNGKQNGVDLIGSDMNYFMGVKILQELIVMSRVGIYVDMPRLNGTTLLDSRNKRPYIYMYQAEDIRSWTFDETDNPNEFSSLLLTDHNFDYDQQTGLPNDEIIRYRFIYLKDVPDVGRRVFCQLYTQEGYACDENGLQITDEYSDSSENEFQVGNLTKIPFHMLDIQNSLLSDVANYQIAHLNLASGDIWYASRANFPFYIEPYDPKSQSPYIKGVGEETFDSTDSRNNTTTTTNSSEVVMGPSRGRRYPTGTNQPAFIHPSTEPLTASMAKQEQIKLEIRQLVNLSLNNLASLGENTEIGEGLENGLSYLSKLLEYAEHRIAHFWALYEGTSTEADIQYPDNYSLIPTKYGDKEIASLISLIESTTSVTLRRRAMKTIASIRIRKYVNSAELSKIHAEIDRNDVVIATPANVQIDVEAGLVSLDTASKARGYPDGEVEKAAKDHADRVARIQAAQSPGLGAGAEAAARGVGDMAPNPTAGKIEKKQVGDQTLNPTPTDPTRGPGHANAK